ncbi:MAG: hypothetical protein RBU30_25235 [Polyangia bacterium]|jgi:hypothetical protein|nr:hypothetical protein [Polyangia bacterium]
MKSDAERTQRGLGTLGLVITVVVVALLALGGWTAYCYYDLLDRENSMASSLEGLALFRDGKPSIPRIREKILEKLRSRGGTVSPEDLRVQVEPLTLTNASGLPGPQRKKLEIACSLHGAQSARDAALDRVRAAQETSDALERGGQIPRRRAPAPMAAPIEGKGCSAEQLEELGFSFIQAEARVTLRRGLMKRAFTLEYRSYFSGAIADERPSSKKGSDEEPDED